MSERIIHATVADFDELVKKDGLCLVDFWANWCGPCKMLAPVIEQYVGENKDITVLKVDATRKKPLQDALALCRFRRLSFLRTARKSQKTSDIKTFNN